MYEYFISFMDKYSIVWIYHNFFIHSSADESFKSYREKKRSYYNNNNKEITLILFKKNPNEFIPECKAGLIFIDQLM